MNLQFFIGDVEKITDPLYIGRLKVRIFGDHTLDKEILPTDDLPWATVLNDVHSHSTTGKGQTPLGLRVGSKVVGVLDICSKDDLLKHIIDLCHCSGCCKAQLL